MNWIDIFVIALIVLAVILAILLIVKNRKRSGGCAYCDGQCTSCVQRKEKGKRI